MSLYLEIPNETMNELLDWLEQVNYRKWTLVLKSWGKNNAFFNRTFIEEIKQYGELTPALPFGIQTRPPEDRKAIVDNLFNKWKTYVGYEPRGGFQFQPDTCVCNHILEKGCSYWQGYCFDQYSVVDWMGMRGGWQMPYYASEDNALVPKPEGRGLIIFPHNTLDWRASFELNHEFNTHILNAMSMFDNYAGALGYLIELLDRTLNNITPFGYAMIQHEWMWVRRCGLLDELKNYTLTVMNSPYLFQTVNETAKWFKQHYMSNPSYYVNFVTPYHEKKVEWLWTRNFRVTRYDEQYVVGYVDYTRQNVDPYINKSANVDFQGERNQTNKICTNLEFLIDDFGNATYRAPPKGNRMIFTGALEDFPSYFNDDTRPTIYSPIQQPTSDAVHPYQRIKVLVRIVDLESGVKNATLYFNLNNSTEWRLTQMSYNQSSGFYEAVIPSQVGSTYVKYKIVAYDNAENKAEQNNNGQFFIYSVLPEVSLLPMLLLLIGFLIILTFCVYALYRTRARGFESVCDLKFRIFCYLNFDENSLPTYFSKNGK